MIRRIFRWLALIFCVGIIAGSASALFLVTLAYVTETREQQKFLYFLLPIFAAIVGIIYHYWGKESSGGNNLIIKEIYQPKSLLPRQMPLLIYFTTLLTHLGGGSAGREGTAVQMSGGFADWIGSYFPINSQERTLLLLCGISAGFGSIFGTPITGFLFALELTKWKYLKIKNITPILGSAVWANSVCHLWQVKHQIYQIHEFPNFEWELGLSIVGLAVVSGFFTKFFVFLHQIFHSLFAKISHLGLRAFCGGIVMVILNWVTMFRYAGIGTNVISEAFQRKISYFDSLLKLIFTTITLGSGMKGGEVTPLFFIGSTLGNSVANVFGQSVGFYAGLGLVSVFGAPSKTPLACTIMAFELFGIEIVPYALVSCWVAYYVSGKKGIYQNEFPKD